MARFDDYATKYRIVRMERRDGLLQMTLHTDGGPLQWGLLPHGELPQAFRDVGGDPDNTVIVPTGTGDVFSGPRAAGGTGMRSMPAEWDRVYREGKHLLMSLDIEVPMISAINGPRVAALADHAAPRSPARAGCAWQDGVHRRPQHGSDHGRLRPHHRPRLRPHPRLGPARRDPRERGRDPRVPGHVGGRVFSNPTARENVDLGGFIVRDPASLARSLELVYQTFPRLQERAGQRAGTLSGGERQMLIVFEDRPASFMQDDRLRRAYLG